jgi:hypothetical protein
LAAAFDSEPNPGIGVFLERPDHGFGVTHACGVDGGCHGSHRDQEADMTDSIFLMHDDAIGDDKAWGPYLDRLKQDGFFEGGSAIGGGVCARRSGELPPVTSHLIGYIRVNADGINQAKSLLAGNPVFEAGGTVEIRELPRTD